MKSKLELVICKNCMGLGLDKYTLIVKTKAKKEYLLKDGDLIGLQEYMGTGAFGRGQTTYYTKYQLIQKACQVHGTTPDLLAGKLTTLLEQKQIQKANRKANSIKKKYPNRLFELMN
jgi:hypothetical protein